MIDLKGATCDTIGYIPRHLRICYDFQGVDMNRTYRPEAKGKPIPEVEQLDAVTGEVVARYKNTVVASRETGYRLDSIRRVIQGRSNTLYGFKWRKAC